MPSLRADEPEARSTTTLGAQRRDIQALRAFAVIAVVLYHIAPDSLPGGFVGVDVFFVVSGFLVGGALVQEVVATGRVALGRFYARRLRRIAPLATVVAVVAIGGTIFTSSPLRLILWGSPEAASSVTRDGVASVLGVANLWFGYSDVGYAMNSYVSPFTHYWSLGVEEQFYLLAPFVIALAFRAGRKVGVLVICAASVLAFDLTVAGLGTAGVGTFYSPLSRSWELGLGVLVAVAAPWVRGAASRAAVMTGAVWIAWLALAWCTMAIPSPTGWPSAAALVPVIATTVILAAGATRKAGGLASFKPVQWLGDRSYGIYLWHWPIIVIAVPESPLPREATWVVAIAATLALSAASFVLIERPFRGFPLTSRREVRRMLITGGATISIGLLVMLGAGLWASLSPLTAPVTAQRYQLAEAGAPQQEFATVVPQNVRPRLVDASSDKPIAYWDRCNVATIFDEIRLSDCVYGTSGPVVALFGDSHALQWLGALLPATARGEIRVALVTADACPPFDPASLDYRDVCVEWHKLAIAQLNRIKPDLIVASASLSEAALKDTDSDVTASLAVARLASELHGMPVLWLADTPALDQDPSACAAQDVTDITSCATPRNKALSSDARTLVQQAIVANGWDWLDLSDYLCDDAECGIILGDIFMYRDDDHLSTTFATELAPVVMQTILPLTDR